jgi:hypothetical protein
MDERKRGVLRETEEVGRRERERERGVLNFFGTDWLISRARFEIFKVNLSF